MQEQGDAALAPGGVWQQACENFNGEQLAYVAALATGAKLAFGDRPKEITYRWGGSKLYQGGVYRITRPPGGTGMGLGQAGHARRNLQASSWQGSTQACRPRLRLVVQHCPPRRAHT
jgi:hypothetical protein